VGLIERQNLATAIAPPLDASLTRQLLDEYVSMERRYVQRDWEPTELDGGQFCELLARVLYHQDSGRLSPAKSFDDCAEYIENEKVPHQLIPRQDPLILVRSLRTIYKLRSKRGAVHISPSYSANEMDSRYMIESIRWCMNETLRIFWRGDREAVAKAIRELIQFDVPCVGRFESAIVVQRTDLTAEEEILVLLHYAGDAGFTRSEIGTHAQQSPSVVTRALQRLTGRAVRQVVRLPENRYRLTDLGSKRVRTELADQLLAE
jgi:hypothetical protein